jgi:lipoprotein NlpI
MDDSGDESPKKTNYIHRTKAANHYTRDEYEEKLKENKKQRLDYLLTLSEVRAFMGKDALPKGMVKNRRGLFKMNAVNTGPIFVNLFSFILL